MKWILLWVAISPNNGLTSGSASFDNRDACLAAEGVMQSLVKDAARASNGIAEGDHHAIGFARETVCVSSETGERVSSSETFDEFLASQRRSKSKAAPRP